MPFFFLDKVNKLDKKIKRLIILSLPDDQMANHHFGVLSCGSHTCSVVEQN
jgi:hypothetical protein